MKKPPKYLLAHKGMTSCYDIYQVFATKTELNKFINENFDQTDFLEIHLLTKLSTTVNAKGKMKI